MQNQLDLSLDPTWGVTIRKNLLKGENGQTHKTFQGQTWTANELLWKSYNTTKKHHIQPVQTLREVSPLPLTPSIHYKTIIETLQRTLVPQKYFTCRLLKTGAFAVHHHHLLIFSSNRCPAIKLHATALLHVQNLRRQRSHGQGDGSSPPDGEVNDKDARYEGISPCSKKWSSFKSVGDGKI